MFGRIVPSIRSQSASSSWRRPLICVQVQARYFHATATVGNGDDTSLARFAQKDGSRRFIFIGGKGGVGKTTTSAALSLKLAQSGLRTLCVSTDPAHSLGDVLGAKLGATPKKIECGGHPLFAMEVDPDVAVAKWQSNMNIDRVRAMLAENRGGFGAGVISAVSSIPGVDMNQFLKILETVPPGLDEVVALGEIMRVVEDDSDKGFDRIVVDTAPTGHTLRLLDLPMFLHQFTDLILKTSNALPSLVVKPLSGFMSALGGAGNLQDQLSITGKSMTDFKSSMDKLNTVLTDKQKTDFVLVTIPTYVALCESERLFRKLSKANLPVQNIVVNHFSTFRLSLDRLAELDIDFKGSNELEREWLMDAVISSVTRSQAAYPEWKKLLSLGSHVTTIPTLPSQLTGVDMLQHYADQLFDESPLSDGERSS